MLFVPNVIAMRKLFYPLAALALFVAGAGFIASREPLIGKAKGGGYIVATGQTVRPAGDVLAYAGRPVDMALSPDGKTLYLKDEKGLVSIDMASWKMRQQWPFPKEGGSSLHGLIVSRDGTKVYASGAQNTVWEAAVAPDGTLSLSRAFTLAGPGGKGASFPCGLALDETDAAKKQLFVCLSRNNTIASVDLSDGKTTKEMVSGVAPFDIVVVGSRLLVSNWGGRMAKDGDLTADSAGTPTVVDERGVANTGTVGLIDTQGKMAQEIAVGLHPSDIVSAGAGSPFFVANANDDTVSVVSHDTSRVLESLLVKPDAGLPFGSAPNALALSPDKKTLFVACGGNNAVAVVRVGDYTLPKPRLAEIVGWIPAGWYPGALATDGKYLYIANIKGNGSRTPAKDSTAGFNVYQYQGTVQRVPLPDAKTLVAYTKQVIADSRVPEVLRAREKAQSGAKPIPVPKNAGEPSVFEHVVYVIKENRTYDQMLGDLKQGNGDPKLCLYGREITPNQHALAEEFVLLDNFYCNGVLSADGHSWVTEGNVTDHLEKAFGGFTRSYTFGDDPITYSVSGFLWDNALAHGLSFRNFGEMDYTDESPDVSFAAVYKDWQEKGGKITFKHKIGIDRLRRYSSPDAPGWNMDIPDQVRADVFLKELAGFEAAGKMPNLTILYLPNDHTTGLTPGDPTPRAYLADNDLALGRVVDGLSHSKFWPKTCIFVVEDDPQSGFDHVDGHRSISFVVSPYTRRGMVISAFYNQTSVIHTMEQILGLPPMNQMDAQSPLMSKCFTDTPDLRPFTHKANTVSLTEVNPPKTAMRPSLRPYATLSERQNFKDVDAANDKELNAILWHAAKGR